MGRQHLDRHDVSGTGDDGSDGHGSCTVDPASAGNNWTATTCPTVLTGPIGVSSCTPATGDGTNAWTTTTCTPNNNLNVPAASCTASGPTAANGYTTTSCTPNNTSMVPVATCSPGLPTAGNGYTTTTCVPNNTTNVPSGSCTPSGPTVGNGYTTTSCPILDSGVIGASSCTAATAGAGNNWTTTLCPGTALTGPTATGSCTNAIADSTNQWTATTCAPVTTGPTVVHNLQPGDGKRDQWLRHDDLCTAERRSAGGHDLHAGTAISGQRRRTNRARHRRHHHRGPERLGHLLCAWDAAGAASRWNGALDWGRCDDLPVMQRLAVPGRRQHRQPAEHQLAGRRGAVLLHHRPAHAGQRGARTGVHRRQRSGGRCRPRRRQGALAAHDDLQHRARRLGHHQVRQRLQDLRRLGRHRHADRHALCRHPGRPGHRRQRRQLAALARSVARLQQRQQLQRPARDRRLLARGGQRAGPLLQRQQPDLGDCRTGRSTGGDHGAGSVIDRRGHLQPAAGAWGQLRLPGELHDAEVDGRRAGARDRRQHRVDPGADHLVGARPARCEGEQRLRQPQDHAVSERGGQQPRRLHLEHAGLRRRRQPDGRGRHQHQRSRAGQLRRGQRLAAEPVPEHDRRHAGTIDQRTRRGRRQPGQLPARPARPGELRHQHAHQLYRKRDHVLGDIVDCAAGLRAGAVRDLRATPATRPSRRPTPGARRCSTSAPTTACCTRSMPAPATPTRWAARKRGRSSRARCCPTSTSWPTTTTSQRAPVLRRRHADRRRRLRRRRTWKTMLVGGLNDGGKGYYALDVTDPVAAKGDVGVQAEQPVCPARPGQRRRQYADCDLGLYLRQARSSPSSATAPGW